CNVIGNADGHRRGFITHVCSVSSVSHYPGSHTTTSARGAAGQPSMSLACFFMTSVISTPCYSAAFLLITSSRESGWPTGICETSLPSRTSTAILAVLAPKSVYENPYPAKAPALTESLSPANNGICPSRATAITDLRADTTVLSLGT